PCCAPLHVLPYISPSASHPTAPSSPTRRSSDLYSDAGELGLSFSDLPFAIPNHRSENGPATAHVRIGWFRSVANINHAFAIQSRSEEHTSELQSPDHLVCRLLLEKKN